MHMGKIRVAVIEDQENFADNIKRVLSKSNNFEFAGCHYSAEEALGALEQDRADVYITDLRLPGMNGAEFIAQASKELKNTRYIVYTISESTKDLLAALAVGASGYMLKDSSDEFISDSVTAVASDGLSVSLRMLRRLAHYSKMKNTEQADSSNMETSVFNMVLAGISHDNIAKCMNMSIDEIQSYIKRIYHSINK